MRLLTTTGDITIDGQGGGSGGDCGDPGWPLAITAGAEGGHLVFEPPALTGELFLVITVEGLDEDAPMVMVEFLSHGDEPQASLMYSFVPRLPATTYFPLASLASQSLPRQPRRPGRLRRGLWGARMDPAEVSCIRLHLGPYYRSRSLKLHRFEVAAAPPDCSLQKSPTLVDSLGQLTFRSWEGRSESVDELVTYLRSERGRAVKAVRSGDGQGDSPYGGWDRRRFEASGYFRTEHNGRRWWLVTPDGKAFYSVGIDSVRPGDSGYIKGIEALYQWLPPAEGEYKDAYEKEGFFSFARANLIRAYGGDWWLGWAELTRARLHQWGVNTIGNWSDPRFCQWARMPYVRNLQGFPSTETTIFRDFPDVFSDCFRQRAEAYAAQLVPLQQDPYMVGYFMINEPYWAVGSATNLARELFRTSQRLASKEHLVDFLRQRYQDDIQRLNTAWQTALRNFGDILNLAYAELAPDGAVEEDLMDFTHRMVDEYVRVPAQALRRVDGNHLNLGLRYARVTSELAYIGHQYVDVYSMNGYYFQPPPALVQTIHDRTGKPVFIGEFHFGGADAGLCRFGVRSVANQQQRGQAYRHYVEQAAALPALVGTHWYQYPDQEPLGRLDGEAYQIGVVDVCQRPYAPFVQAMQAAHNDIYAVAAGNKPPYNNAVPPLRTRWW